MSSSVSSVSGRARRWRSPVLATVMLGVLVVAGTATNPVAAQSFVDHHVVFDNSASKAGHHHSETHLVGPSTLKTESGRIPVDTSRFTSAPNSLRLEWNSAPGGEWRATVRIPARYARKFRYEGDALVLQVLASDPITAANSPRISLRDDTGFTSPTIDLIRGRDTLAAGRWTETRQRLRPHPQPPGFHGSTTVQRRRTPRPDPVRLLPVLLGKRTSRGGPRAGDPAWRSRTPGHGRQRLRLHCADRRRAAWVCPARRRRRTDAACGPVPRPGRPIPRSLAALPESPRQGRRVLRPV